MFLSHHMPGLCVGLPRYRLRWFFTAIKAWQAELGWTFEGRPLELLPSYRVTAFSPEADSWVSFGSIEMCTTAHGVCGLQVALQNFPTNDSDQFGRAASVPSQRVALQHQVPPPDIPIACACFITFVCSAFCLLQPLRGQLAEIEIVTECQICWRLLT